MTDLLDKQLFTISDICKAFSFSKSKVRRMIETGELASVRIGGCRRITRAAMNKLLRSIGTQTLDEQQMARVQIEHRKAPPAQEPSKPAPPKRNLRVVATKRNLPHVRRASRKHT